MRISDWSSDVCSSDLDQVGDLGDHVHVRCLERALDDAAEAGRAGRRHRGLARGRGLEKPVLADGVEARLVGEIGQLELADAPRGHLAVEVYVDLSALAPRDGDGIDRSRAAWWYDAAVAGHVGPGGAAGHGAGAGGGG